MRLSSLAGKRAGGSERANYQLFLGELCALLELPQPEPAHEDTRDNAYVFERRVTFRHGDGSESAGFIDLYRRGAFVLEAKKLRRADGRGFDDAMQRARGQAEQYARALPAAEESRGLIRWLRPEFQHPGERRAPAQAEIEIETEEIAAVAGKAAKLAWPKELPEQVRRVADVLAAARSPIDDDALAAHFTGRGPWKKRLPQIVETLVSLGRARRVEGGVIGAN